MNRSHSRPADAERKPKEHFFSYSEAVFDVILIGAGTFLLAWLKLPSYLSWIIVAVCVLLIIGARLFRRNSSRVQH